MGYGCLIPTGITSTYDNCDGEFGGVLKLYIANKGHVSKIGKDANDNVTGITMIGGGKFYNFDFVPEVGAGLTEELQSDNGGFVQQTVAFSVQQLDQNKKKVLSRMKRAYMLAIVQQSDGTYKLAGETGLGLKSGATSVTTGQAATDIAGATVSLVGNTLDYANTVTMTTISTILS